MSRRIASGDDHTLLVPIHTSSNIGSRIANGEPAPSAVGVVRLRSVKQQIGMQRALPCPQRVVDDRAVLLRIFDRLIEYVMLTRITGTKREMSDVM